MQVLELSFCQNETNWRQFWIFTALLGDGLLQGQRFGLLGNNVQTTDSCAGRRWSPGCWISFSFPAIGTLAPSLATLESYFTGFLVLFVASMITRFEPNVEIERRVWKLVCYLFYVGGGGGNVWMEVNVHWKKEIFESFLTSLPTSGKVAFLMSHSNSLNFIFYLPFTFKMSSKFEPWLRATVWIQISGDGNGFVSSMSRPGSSSGPTLYSLHRSDRSFYPDLLAN